MQVSRLRLPRSWGIKSINHLDFGCGFGEFQNPFDADNVFGADIIEQPGRLNYFHLDESGILPVPDGTFDTISAFDVIEHLSREGRPNQFIKFMSEAHRALSPGGILFSVTPAYPNATAFQDPTHVNVISDQTIHYFVGRNAPARTNGYLFSGNFSLVSQFWTHPRVPIRKRDELKSYSRSKIFFDLIRNLKSSRSLLSQYRNPSHLVWVLRKETNIDF